ncbi:polymerase-associated protein [Drosophila sturtevanti sigmavirus]|uniref:Polymerase-associated protein n=1 Tax=Drosophila sturtevanti sigmavirus TaxID=1802946 RepID=A0A140D8M5_9RHAB|nr:polymerase-associated protein [Drosophila sturtevanti sigmavirus]AMK09249.1 polymerase-associated protein [Drosophila sturtevanti sigmavirus]
MANCKPTFELSHELDHIWATTRKAIKALPKLDTNLKSDQNYGDNHPDKTTLQSKITQQNSSGESDSWAVLAMEEPDNKNISAEVEPDQWPDFDDSDDTSQELEEDELFPIFQMKNDKRAEMFSVPEVEQMVKDLLYQLNLSNHDYSYHIEGTIRRPVLHVNKRLTSPTSNVQPSTSKRIQTPENKTKSTPPKAVDQESFNAVDHRYNDLMRKNYTLNYIDSTIKSKYVINKENPDFKKSYFVEVYGANGKFPALDIHLIQNILTIQKKWHQMLNLVDFTPTYTTV